MPQFDSGTRTKIDTLRALVASGHGPQAFELCKVSWTSDEADAVYYSVMQTDEVADPPPPVSPIEVRLVPDGSPNWFLPVQMDSTIGDEEVDLKFWDADGVISDLLVANGEGCKVELFYWFPQVELLLPIWHGHLRFEDEAAVDIVPLKAAQGFRSSDASVPHRAHWQECQAIFGGVFDTQAEIDEGDCPYNRQIGGGAFGNLNGGVPYTSCPRRTQGDCDTRLGTTDGRYHLSHRTIETIRENPQTKGPRLYSISRGNETNLKEPVRVVMGERRIYDMQVLAFRRDQNNRDPDHGWFIALYEACEGPVASISQAVIKVGEDEQNAQAQHYGSALGFTPQTEIAEVTSHGYPGTALISYNFGWIDPTTVGPSDASANVRIQGLQNIRVYTDDDSYTSVYTNNRAWQLARVLCDKRWGFGYDYDRLSKTSWIEAANWCAEYVTYTDTFGTAWTHFRSQSDVDLISKKVQQQVEDLCMAGRLSRPFLFDGQIHVVPLRALTDDELAACPVFTDEGSTGRNVIFDTDGDTEKSTLKISRKSDLELPNRIECTYDSALNGYQETPLQPVEDIDQQLRAGRVVGDKSRKINPKKFALLGVTTEAQAIKMAWSLLDLGELDEGGLQNNLKITFKCWFMDTLDLHPYKVIRFNSSRLTRYGFSYFRIMKMKRLDGLQYEIEAQAYNETYMASFETVISSPLDPGEFPPSPEPGPLPSPCILKFGSVTWENGKLSIPVDPC